MKIAIVGDIHGKFDALERIVTLERENGGEPLDAIIQCGDFGVWTNNWDGKVRVNFDHIPVYFCRGNHEEHNALDRLSRTEIQSLNELHPDNSKNIFHCPFGSVLTIERHNFLFVGGADSIDKQWRTKDVSWWEQETISEAQMEAFRKKELPEINFVISHTCPDMILKEEKFKNLFDSEYMEMKNVDPSCQHLQEVFERVKPQFWFFGHWHERYFNHNEDTLFACLPMYESFHARMWSNYNDYYATVEVD